MTNWSLIILGLVAVSSVALAENSYLVIVPKLLKVGWENQVSVFIGAASQPVEVKFELTIGQTRIVNKTTCKQGETRNASLTLPMEFPIGAGELTIVGTGGVQFEEKRDVIIYDDRHVILVQTSASSYQPGDIMEVRVVATNENLIPIENGEVTIEIYDATLKLMAEYPRFPIRSGLTETIKFHLNDYLNAGTWLVSATIGNTTSSVQVLVARPITPSFDLKAIFQRFLLRTDKNLRGVVEISSDCDQPIFGRATIAIGQVTEQDLPKPTMQKKPEHEMPMRPENLGEEHLNWKSQTMEIAGRVEINYELLSLFNVDLTKALAIQVYIEVTELASGQQRIIRHIIPVFARDIIYDIRPLQFEAGLKNEFEVIAKRPDGKPVKMEDMIVTVHMIFPGENGKPQEEKLVEIKDFYTRGRNDIGLFNLEIPKNCIGVLMTMTPLGEDGKMRGYRTQAVPLMPMPARRATGAKLSIELAPATTTPTNVDASVVSTQITTVGKTANFYVQLLPSKPVEKFEPLPMSYVLLTNGKIILTGEFTVQPTKECQTKAPRTVQPEHQTTPSCVYNGTLSFPVTRAMMPYSTLLVYTFQPSFGYNVAEGYRFSVAGLFQSTLTLNATIVPYTPSITDDKEVKGHASDVWEDSSEMKLTPVSSKAQGKTGVELSFTGTPEATVGLNVVEYDAISQGLSNEITKERLLHYLSKYEHVPISGMPTSMTGEEQMMVPRDVQTPRKLDSKESSEEVTTKAYKTVKKVPTSMTSDKNIRTRGLQVEQEQDDEQEHEERGLNQDQQPRGLQGEQEQDDEQEHQQQRGLNQNQQPRGLQGEQEQDDEQEHQQQRGLNQNQQPRGLQGEQEQDDEQEQQERGLNNEQDEDTQEHEERFIHNEQDEEKQNSRERLGHKARYPIEKMVFGIGSSRPLLPVEGDDAYVTPNMGRFYGDERSRPVSLNYRRRGMKTLNQYDVSVENNDFVIATSMPRVLAMPPKQMPHQQQPSHPHMDREEQEGNDDESEQQRGQQSTGRSERTRYGTPAWYEKMHSKLNAISQEAFTFLHSGLSIVSDFESLRVPVGLQRMNLSSTWSKLRTRHTYGDRDSFSVRDDARQLLEEYMTKADASMVPPPIMLEEQARSGYYQSIFFNTSRIGAQGTGKVIVPRTKPYSTWLATGFSLHAKQGLAIAQPIRLPTNQGLFVLANFPQTVQVGEHALLTYGINNYLGKDLSNVIVRIRASSDFDLIEQTQPERVASASGKDYTVTIPTLKTLGVETRNIVLVPKRCGVIKILIEVESEFGGDSELFTTYVRESGIKRTQLSAHLFDLTGEKKTFGPFVEKITQSPFLRFVKLAVSGTGLDRFVQWHPTQEMNSLLGIDRAIIKLYRSLGLRRYLNATSQRESVLFNMTTANISTAYQKLQLYADYDGSYSFVSDEGAKTSSLYLSSLAFGAMISPMMPFRDNVTLNRTLSYILSHQQQDGSFEDNGPCFHKRFCTGELRRESMTALVLYSLTNHNATQFMPEFVRRRVLGGENSPIVRAQRFLESRINNIKPNLLVLSFVELAFVHCNCISEQLQQRIREALFARQLTVVPEDGSKYLKFADDKMSFDDQILLNSMTLSLYAHFGDFKTTSAIARYIVGQIQSHPHFDNVFDALFRTQAWLNTDCLFRKKFGSEKFAVTVDVTTDNGQKQQFKIDEQNIDVTQKLKFKMPVQTVTYSVSGFGIAAVCLKQVFIEKQQPSISSEAIPFQLTQEFSPLPWLSEIKAKTCVTYTPTQQQRLLVSEKWNSTIAVEVQLPSGMRINIRQIGFFLSKIENVMHFTYNVRCNKLTFFINLPLNMVGKPICLEWCLERLSQVINYAPIEIRAYEYTRPDMTYSRLVPVQIQPALLGYSFVDAVMKARPSLDTVINMQPRALGVPPTQPTPLPSTTRSVPTTRAPSTTRIPRGG